VTAPGEKVLSDHHPPACSGPRKPRRTSRSSAWTTGRSGAPGTSRRAVDMELLARAAGIQRKCRVQDEDRRTGTDARPSSTSSSSPGRAGDGLCGRFDGDLPERFPSPDRAPLQALPNAVSMRNRKSGIIPAVKIPWDRAKPALSPRSPGLAGDTRLAETTT